MSKLYKKVEVSRHHTLNDTGVESLGTWVVDGDTDILIESFSDRGAFTVCFDSTVEIEVADDRVLSEKPGLIDPRGKAWRIA